jgi:hypothetical protein
MHQAAANEAPIIRVGEQIETYCILGRPCSIGGWPGNRGWTRNLSSTAERCP